MSYIMLVEDNPDDAILVQEGISAVSNIEVKTFPMGQLALEFLEKVAAADPEGQQAPRLIILDGNLPDIEGLDVLKKIREMEPFKRTAIIIYTGTYGDEQRKQFYSAGANVFIKKTADFVSVAEFLLQAGWLTP